MNAQNKSMEIKMQAFYIRSFTFKHNYDTHSIPAIITIAEYPWRWTKNDVMEQSWAGPEYRPVHRGKMVKQLYLQEGGHTKNKKAAWVYTPDYTPEFTLHHCLLLHDYQGNHIEFN